MTIARFTPINDVVSLREAMDRLFEDSIARRLAPSRTIKNNATANR